MLLYHPALDITAGHFLTNFIPSIFSIQTRDGSRLAGKNSSGYLKQCLYMGGTNPPEGMTL